MPAEIIDATDIGTHSPWLVLDLALICEIPHVCEWYFTLYQHVSVDLGGEMWEKGIHHTSVEAYTVSEKDEGYCTYVGDRILAKWRFGVLAWSPKI